jgi:hypothetical protein
MDTQVESPALGGVSGVLEETVGPALGNSQPQGRFSMVLSEEGWCGSSGYEEEIGPADLAEIPSVLAVSPSLPSLKPQIQDV